MSHENQEPEYHNTNILSVLVGLLVGALAGALTMLLLAPQSGEDTRTQIKEKSIELRDRTTEMIEDTMAQVRANRDKITMGGRRKAQELLHQGQALVVEQLEHVSEAAQAGKKAIQSS
ncbi:MAG: YtxH domain-containing protein [Anaerolineaceae bacterium]|nr:MAG: YtxH domain-containing protein [Anaerolineaceae bacterium]